MLMRLAPQKMLTAVVILQFKQLNNPTAINSTHELHSVTVVLCCRATKVDVNSNLNMKHNHASFQSHVSLTLYDHCGLPHTATQWPAAKQPCARLCTPALTGRPCTSVRASTTERN
jgi:hypothetical protein